MPREKSRYREKRSVSYDSGSSYDKKRSKTKHKRRSRSTDRSESRRKRKRSSSRSRRKSSYSRSLSRDRYESRKSPSKSKSKSYRQSPTRDHSRSRDRSRSRSKYSKTKQKSRRRSRSRSSRSSSLEIERPDISKRVNLDDTDSKIAKAIKAAEAAGLTMIKIPTYKYTEVEIREDMPTITDRNLLEEINNDSFVQKTFKSSQTKKKKNIVIDLNSDTVIVPDADAPKDDSIINFAAIPNEEELREMWIKKLYTFRKKMLKGDI